MPVQTPLLSSTSKGYLEKVNYLAKLKASWNKLVFQAKNNKFKYGIYWQTQIKHELYSLSLNHFRLSTSLFIYRQANTVSIR